MENSNKRYAFSDWKSQGTKKDPPGRVFRPATGKARIFEGGLRNAAAGAWMCGFQPLVPEIGTTYRR